MKKYQVFGFETNELLFESDSIIDCLNYVDDHIETYSVIANKTNVLKIPYCK